MKHLDYSISYRDAGTSDKSSVGGKGHNLLWLYRNGVEVPPFIIITTKSFSYYQEHKKLPEKITEHLNQFFTLFPNALFAVRSSMSLEDGSEHSFAGLFDTFLEISQKNVEQKIIEVFHSVNSDRVKAYCLQKNIDPNLGIAVVVQLQINSHKSGVAFSRSPIKPTSLISIDAGLGLGEGVVSGTTDVQTLQLMRGFNGVELISKNGPDILQKDEWEKLSQVVITLEDKYKKPCDIEWCFDDQEKLYILQIRPITDTFKPLVYMVDTNLSESYPGIISPLTEEFVKSVYHITFYESAEALGASKKRLAQVDPHFQNLLTSVDHHLYYNLEHYYAVLRTLPGGDKNITNWHHMIGGNSSAQHIPIHGKKLSKWETIVGLFNILRFIILHKNIFKKFLKHASAKRDWAHQKILNTKNGKDLLAFNHDLIQTKLQFGLAVVNDVLIMVGLGLLMKRLKKFPDLNIIELLKTQDELTSIGPLRALEKLINEVPSDFFERMYNYLPQNWEHPYQEFYLKEKSNGGTKIIEKVEKFLEEYGDRSFEELKIESLTFKQSPQVLAQTAIWLSKQKNRNTHINRMQNTPIELDIVTKFILYKTRQFIEMRETTRLWRGRFYNLVRQAHIKSANLLRNENPNWDHFTLMDYFSLTHREWKNFSLNKISIQQVENLISERKHWITSKQKFPELIIWSPDENLPIIETNKTCTGLSGMGVAHGEVNGKALVIEKPEEAFGIDDLENYILVTKNTDPAWVFIMSKSKGLVSEKGSLLSHTAIIGRELNIPTVVGVKHATTFLKTGDQISLNGKTGEIKKI